MPETVLGYASPAKDILIDPAKLQARIAELGTQIDSDYAGQELVLVCILKGGVLFLTDLMRAIHIPHAIDFMADQVAAKDVCLAMARRGVLTKDTHETVIRFAPPLIIEAADVLAAVDVFAAALEDCAPQQRLARRATSAEPALIAPQRCA